MNEGKGVLIHEHDMSDIIHLGSEDSVEVNLSEGTTMSDWNDCCYVLRKSKIDGCTWSDLEAHSSSASADQVYSDDDCDVFDTYRDTSTSLSAYAMDMQDSVRAADEDTVHKSEEQHSELGEQQMDDLRKQTIIEIDKVLKSTSIPNDQKRLFCKSVTTMKDQLFNEYPCDNPHKGMGDYHFPNIDRKGERAEKRKRNALDY